MNELDEELSEDFLSNIIPQDEGEEYFARSVTIHEEAENDVEAKLTAHFRAKIETKEEFESWVDKLSKKNWNFLEHCMGRQRRKWNYIWTKKMPASCEEIKEM